jgi:hypothetical protein
MNEKEIIALLDRYDKDDCTAYEISIIESWYNYIAAQTKADLSFSELEEKDLQISSHFPGSANRYKLPVYIPYAAAVLAIISLVYAMYFSFQHLNNTTNNNKIIAIIKPGGNNATLILANGKKINLKNTRTGSVAMLSGVAVTNNMSSGVVTYQLQGSKSAKENNHVTDQLEINTITTPIGGQYILILPDGTRVFLNNLTSLQFPTSFAASSRRVTLIGEAYFEVAENVKKPFIVSTPGQELTVLGTHFSISAYPNETIKTTLAEGSVQLLNSSSLKKQILQPEQQTVLTNTGFELKSVNSADEMAWKDGLFIFRKTPIADVLHQLCRWYNMEADFNNLPDTKLNADLSRSATLQDIINVLNFINSNKGIKVKIIDGKRLEIIKTK